MRAEGEVRLPLSVESLIASNDEHLNGTDDETRLESSNSEWVGVHAAGVEARERPMVPCHQVPRSWGDKNFIEPSSANYGTDEGTDAAEFLKLSVGLCGVHSATCARARSAAR